MADSDNVPPLVPLHWHSLQQMRGPTPCSNWVIPGQVVAGAFPAAVDDASTTRTLGKLLELGINTFVCLQSEFDLNASEASWRSGRTLRPYIYDAQLLLTEARNASHPTIRQAKLDFLHLSIDDGATCSDSAMNRLADDCCERVRAGEKLYVHCWGGHGRTGVLVATMLGKLYRLHYTEALRSCQAYHDSRVHPQNVQSPQTSLQRTQVRRLLSSRPASLDTSRSGTSAHSGGGRRTLSTLLCSPLYSTAPPILRTPTSSSSSSPPKSSLLKTWSGPSPLPIDCSEVKAYSNAEAEKSVRAWCSNNVAPVWAKSEPTARRSCSSPRGPSASDTMTLRRHFLRMHMAAPHHSYRKSLDSSVH